MTDKQQPEALRLAAEAWNFDCSKYRGVRSANAALMGMLQDCADMIRRLHTKNETLQQGYAAARLEIESLRTRSAEPVGEYPALPKFNAGAVATEASGKVEMYPAAFKQLLSEIFDRGAREAAGAWRAYVDADRSMRAAQPAGAQQPGAGTWTPLPGTLPEPGKPVLLDIGTKYPIRAMWAAKNTVQAIDDDSDWGEYDEATDTYYCPEGWYEWNEHEDVHWRVDKTPMAWCELTPKE